MGTSSRNPGPSPKTPLIPPWADIDDLDDLFEPESEIRLPDTDQDPGEEVQDTEQNQDNDEEQIQEYPARLRGFRKKMGQYLRGGNTENLRKALGSYIRSNGGVNLSVRKTRPAINSIAGLASFINNYRLGQGETIKGLNLASLAGQSFDQISEQIIGIFAPLPGMPENENIRQSMYQALSDCCVVDNVLDIDNITENNITSLILNFLTDVISTKMYSDIGDIIDKHLPEPQDQYNFLQTIKSYLKSTIDSKALPRMQNTLSTTINSHNLQNILTDIITEVFETIEGWFND